MSNKTAKALCCLASALFYMVAIIRLFNTGASAAVVWLCLGSAFLCFASSAVGKIKKSDNEDDFDKK